MPLPFPPRAARLPGLIYGSTRMQSRPRPRRTRRRRRLRCIWTGSRRRRNANGNRGRRGQDRGRSPPGRWISAPEPEDAPGRAGGAGCAPVNGNAVSGEGTRRIHNGGDKCQPSGKEPPRQSKFLPAKTTAVWRVTGFVTSSWEGARAAEPFPSPLGRSPGHPALPFSPPLQFPAVIPGPFWLLSRLT